MNPALVVGTYSLLIVAASLMGGLVPSRFAISHLRMQIILSFVGGLMLGIGLLHLLPHSLEHMLPRPTPSRISDTSPQSRSSETPVASTESPTGAGFQPTHLDYVRAINRTFLSAMAGLLGMFFLIRLFHFHQHGPVTGTGDHECGHHDHSHHQLSWSGVAFGLSVHSLLDGVALGSAVIADATHSGSAAGLAGFGVFLAVALHKPLDALSITTLMQASKWTRQSQQAVNAGFAAMCPIGAFLVIIAGSTGMLQESTQTLVGIALGVSGGVFLCISLSDLLPEVQFHRHDRIKLSAALLFGVLGAYAIGFLEPTHVLF